LAEYFRVLHADRSEQIISDPLSEIGLLSPTGVIPPRIIKILGKICSCHTKDFDEVLNLPFCEVGIDTENAHPRFIACLLRIGDLLDLDNNRFSEVMLRTLTKVPIDTLNHKAKHLSIESFRVDRECIEIKAVCDNYDVANITQHWFNYLNSEISNQMNNWNIIVPNKTLGYLPTIGKLTVELKNYEFIDGKNKPTFKVDSDHALALLQGAGLYNGTYQSIRELLQNAVDSTLIRIWVENKDRYQFETPNTEEFINLAKKLPIVVSIKDKGGNENWRFWEISIEDKGTGISSEDLKHLIGTGSSMKNKARRKIIDDMPTWMKPSGAFGIGFQSVFLLTDSVTIETKSFFDEKFQIIEFNSPSSIKKGDILIKKRPTNHLIKPGATLNFIRRTETIPKKWSIRHGQKKANLVASNFDPFIHESLDIDISKIADQVLEFSEKCTIPIKLIHKDEEIKSFGSQKFEYFEHENSLEFNINPTSYYRTSNIITFYKGQKTESDISFDFLDFEINIHGAKASDALALNRNKIKESYRSTLYKQVVFSSFSIITTKFHEIFKTEEEKSLASMFLHFYSNISEAKHFNISSYNYWENFNIPLKDGTKKTIKELLNIVEAVKLNYTYSNDLRGDVYDLNKNRLEIFITRGSISLCYTLFFLVKSESLKHIFMENISNHANKIITLSVKEFDNPLSEPDFKLLIYGLKKDTGSSRMIIPCMKKYSKLRLKDEARENYVFHFKFNHELRFSYPKMLSPYRRLETEDSHGILKEELNEKIFDWVFQNRYNEDTTKAEIIACYNSFCKDFNLKEINKPEKNKIPDYLNIGIKKKKPTKKQ
jgi:hypothetical protein